MKYCPECASELGQREHEGRIYRSCEPCGFTHWENPTPVVAAIVELNEQIILVHNKLWPEKMLGLVSGFLERKEAPELAVAREVEEELALTVLKTELIGVYGFEQQNQLIIAYHVLCQGEVQLGDELDAYKLILPDKLKPWAIGTGPAVKDWLLQRQNKKN